MLIRYYKEKFPDRNIVYVLDNEPRNKEICNRISKLIDGGKKVIIWPKAVQQKDINDMVMAFGESMTMKLIINNVYSGLKAKVKYTYWKKV